MTDPKSTAALEARLAELRNPEALGRLRPASYNARNLEIWAIEAELGRRQALPETLPLPAAAPATAQAPAGEQIAAAQAALRSAIAHLEHMADWIEKQRAGYSFEGLGEDMPGIRAAAAGLGVESRTNSRTTDPIEAKLWKRLREIDPD